MITKLEENIVIAIPAKPIPPPISKVNYRPRKSLFALKKKQNQAPMKNIKD